jgi:hypothetical protein
LVEVISALIRIFLIKIHLNSKIIIEKNKGHYIEDKTKEIPIVLEEIITLSK